MDLQTEIIAAETSDKIRLLGIPFIQLRSNGDSYINSLAARLLGFKHGDTLKFYRSADHKNWYIANDEQSGALIKKKSGLYKFCDTKNVKQIFDSYEITGKRANFPLQREVQTINNIRVLWMIPKPYNIE
jgi:hypothetical protein